VIATGACYTSGGDRVVDLSCGHAIAGRAPATTAGDLAWWRATPAVSRRLRHTHRSRAAAITALRASQAVLAAPGAAELPHDAVVHAARATGDLARVLVASGPPCELNVFTSGWEDVVRATSPPPRPTAA
jgi:hypothetical protein